MTELIALWAGVAIAQALAFVIGRSHGTKLGRKWERERAEHILRGALLTRFSPTIHQALVCIAGNQSIKEMKKRLEEIKDSPK